MTGLASYENDMKILLILLVSVASAFAADKELSVKALTATSWKYDQDNVKDRAVRFKADGTVEATTWKGLWKKTGGWTVEVTLKDKRKAVLIFNEDNKSFTGTGFDQMEMRGRRVGDIPSGIK
jgi:hypothetical protein